MRGRRRGRASGRGASDGTYDVLCGKRLISHKRASTEAEAVIDYLRSIGRRDDEMMRVGMDAIAWHGAIYKAVSAPAQQ